MMLQMTLIEPPCPILIVSTHILVFYLNAQDVIYVHVYIHMYIYIYIHIVLSLYYSLCLSLTRQGVSGRISKASVSRFGKSGNSNLVASNPG